MVNPKTYNKPKNLLSKGSSNAKTAKNSLETYILYLAPFKQNAYGKNVCAHASKGCIDSCLFSAGMGKFSNVANARINKTNYLFAAREEFLTQLLNELNKADRKAKKKQEKIAIRLNGTSDLDFIALFKSVLKVDILESFENLVFYDYTKNLSKALKYANNPHYTLTFSRSEDNEKKALEALRNGVNVAAVFAKDLPSEYNGFKVVDGDTSDIVMTYNRGVVLGLRAKGDAKKDTSGFVIR